MAATDLPPKHSAPRQYKWFRIYLCIEESQADANHRANMIILVLSAIAVPIIVWSFWMMEQTAKMPG